MSAARRLCFAGPAGMIGGDSEPIAAEQGRQIMDDQELQPLDAALARYCTALSEALDGPMKAQHAEQRLLRDPQIVLALNYRCHSLKVRGAEIDHALLELPELGHLLEAVRGAMPMIAWPLKVVFEVSGASRERYWSCTVESQKIGFAGLMFDDGRNAGIFGKDRSYRRRGLLGLDRLVEALETVAEALPETNQPVRAWSTAADMMGSRHVGHEVIYASSEAEVTLKQALARNGLPALRAMLDEGRLEHGDGPFRTWFVAIDLSDLDLDPMGRVVERKDAVSEINEHLARKRSQAASV